MNGRLARIRRLDAAQAAASNRAIALTSPAVGASIWQTPGGVQAELGRINDAFLAFSHEIFEYLTTRGYPSPADPVTRGIATLHDVVWTPLIQAWQKFYADNKSWWGNLWWNHAPEAESFERQLEAVRASARKIGMPLLSPEPQRFAPSILFDPTRNLFDETHDVAKDLNLGKIALVTGLGVAGIVLITSLASRGR